MRIGIYASGGLGSAMIGGGFTFQATLLHALATRKNKHEYYILSDEKLVSSANVAHVQLHTQTYRGLRFLERMYAYYTHGGLVARAIKKNSIQAMWYMTPSRLFTQNIPFFYTVWDLEHRKQPYFPEVSLAGIFYKREAHYGAVLPQATKIFVGTEVGKQEIMQFYGVPGDRICVNPMPVPGFVSVPYDVPAHVIERLRANTHGVPFVFYPAQFWPHKNHVVILKALKLLRDRDGANVHCMLTGSDKGNRAYIQQCVVEYGLQDQVHFLGFVSTEEMIALYKNALALVFPTYFGPDNLPPLEAFVLQCPVIASRIPGADEQLGDAALLFEPSHHEQLADYIKKLLQDDSLRALLIKRGTARAQERTVLRYLERVEQAFDEFEKIQECWGR